MQMHHTEDKDTACPNFLFHGDKTIQLILQKAPRGKIKTCQVDFLLYTKNIFLKNQGAVTFSDVQKWKELIISAFLQLWYLRGFFRQKGSDDLES